MTDDKRQASNSGTTTSRGELSDASLPLLQDLPQDGGMQQEGVYNRGSVNSTARRPGLGAVPQYSPSYRVPNGGSPRKNIMVSQREELSRPSRRSYSGDPEAERSSYPYSPVKPTATAQSWFTVSGPMGPQSTPIDHDQRSTDSRVNGGRSSWQRQNLKMFIQGGRRSLISHKGELNVHRLIPNRTKVYLNWLYDTFPSIIRLHYGTLFFAVFVVYVVAIFIYASCLQVIDPHYVCASSVHCFSDYYFFVVQTIFTIGYGGKEPLCFGTNVGVTIISILGMIMHTALTGIVFAKFTLDNSRNVACAFSTRVLAIPPPSSGTSSNDDGNTGMASDDHLRLCFRFVNVFHRHFFHVNMRLFLVEHVSAGDGWSCPTVQEVHYFDTSIPLEFMSLPVEVCAYIPLDRLLMMDTEEEEGNGNFLQEASMADLTCASADSGLSNPSCPSATRRRLNQADINRAFNMNTITMGRQNWIRHFSDQYKHADADVNTRTLPPLPRGNSVEMPRPRATTHSAYGISSGGHSSRLRRMKTITSSNERASSFELVCTIEFMDATTGNEINARKSWPLSDVTWLPAGTESSLCWDKIVQRVGDNGSYDVDVTNLDAMTDEGYDLAEMNCAAGDGDEDGNAPRMYWSEGGDPRVHMAAGGGDSSPSRSPRTSSRGRTFSDWGIEFKGSALPMETSELAQSTESPTAGPDKERASVDLEDPPLNSGNANTAKTTPGSTHLSPRTPRPRNPFLRPRAFSTELVDSL